jgi:hypothetical protein
MKTSTETFRKLETGRRHTVGPSVGSHHDSRLVARPVSITFSTCYRRAFTDPLPGSRGEPTARPSEPGFLSYPSSSGPDAGAVNHAARRSGIRGDNGKANSIAGVAAKAGMVEPPTLRSKAK